MAGLGRPGAVVAGGLLPLRRPSPPCRDPRGCHRRRARAEPSESTWVRGAARSRCRRTTSRTGPGSSRSRPTSRNQRSGWLSVQRMSVAASTSRPSASASFAARLSTITRWLAWKSVWISSQSAATSASTGAPSRMTWRTAAMRSFTVRALRALRRSCCSGSGSSSTSTYQGRSATGAGESSPLSGEVPQRPQHTALRAEREVHGLRGHARLPGDARRPSWPRSPAPRTACGPRRAPGRRVDAACAARSGDW